MKEYATADGAALPEVDPACYGPGATLLDASEYLSLALDCIVSSPTQPRKRFDQAKLGELAASIKADEVHEPIVVRPLPAARLQESFLDRKKGAKLPTHELVFGERRWRASKIAGKTTIPARVKQYTDEQVIRMQMVENKQRDDLHEMEEAEGYAQMMALLKISANQVADEVGISRSTVHARIKLLDLSEPVRAAFYAEKIEQSHALVIARIPDAQLQLKALEYATKADWNGTTPAFKAFQRWVQQNLMLRLDTARFKITDASLVVEAGSCRDCPKRTGANPDLFSDVDSADVCTDPKCFHDKQAVHDEQLLEQAKARGQTIITGAQAKRIWQYEHSGKLNGFKRLDRSDDRIDGKKTLKRMLGRDCPEPVLLQSPFDGSLIEVVAEEKITQVLKDRGLLTASQARASREISAVDAKAKAEEKYQNTWRKLAIERSFEAMTVWPNATISAATIRLLAKLLLHGLTGDDRAHSAALLGVGKVADVEGIKAYLDTCTPDEATTALLLIFMQHDMHFNSYAGIKDPERIIAVADDFKVNLVAIQDGVKAQMKAVVKKVAKPLIPNYQIDYRGPNGEAWSGRGLMPRWLRVLVENGQDKELFRIPPAAPEKAPIPLASAAQASGVGGEAKAKKTEHPLRKPKLSAAAAQAAIAAAMQGSDTNPGAAIASHGNVTGSGSALPEIRAIKTAPAAIDADSLLGQAIALIARTQKANVRLLKTELGIGTTRALELMSELEVVGKVSACNERGARTVMSCQA